MYTLDQSSVYRLRRMLEWFEGQGHGRVPSPARPLHSTESVRPQWLLQPVYVEADDEWKVRVWGGEVVIGNVVTFWPTGLPLDTTKYADFSVSDLEKDALGYVIWKTASTQGYGIVEIVAAADISTFGGVFRILGTVTWSTVGEGESWEHDTLSIRQWHTGTLDIPSFCPWEVAKTGDGGWMVHIPAGSARIWLDVPDELSGSGESLELVHNPFLAGTVTIDLDPVPDLVDWYLFTGTSGEVWARISEGKITVGMSSDVDHGALIAVIAVVSDTPQVYQIARSPLEFIISEDDPDAPLPDTGEDEDACDAPFPGTLPDDPVFDDSEDESPSDDELFPDQGQSGDSSDDEFPGKVNKCW